MKVSIAYLKKKEHCWTLRKTAEMKRIEEEDKMDRLAIVRMRKKR